MSQIEQRISKPKKKKEVAEDETPAVITDHAFESRGEWWDLCVHCHLSEAAHAETIHKGRVHIGYYSDDNPDD